MTREWARPVAALPPCLLAEQDSAQICFDVANVRLEVPFETFPLVSKLHRQRFGRSRSSFIRPLPCRQRPLGSKNRCRDPSPSHTLMRGGDLSLAADEAGEVRVGGFKSTDVLLALDLDSGGRSKNLDLVPVCLLGGFGFVATLDFLYVAPDVSARFIVPPPPVPPAPRSNFDPSPTGCSPGLPVDALFLATLSLILDLLPELVSGRGPVLWLRLVSFLESLPQFSPAQEVVLLRRLCEPS